MAVVAAVLLLAAACSPTATKPAVPSLTGTFTGRIGTAAYLVDVPTRWNRTLLLYSHGYAAPTGGNPASDAGDSTTKAWLLAGGYALAGSSYSGTGWAVADALRDQVTLLAEFGRRFGKPSRTIAWGHSLGGIITAGLVQVHPELFAGALPMCGVLAGGVANWNGALDIGFAAQVLLDPNLQVARITNPGANLNLAQADLNAAAKTPEGKARLALVAALGELPGWFSPLDAEPPAGDFATQAANQARWENFDFVYIFAFRAELEQRAGGNPSWNTGVDYRQEFLQSPGRPEAEALYRQAGLDLNSDLNRIQNSPRVSADPVAVDYLDRAISFDGQLGGVPVLTLHTTGDGLVLPANEAAYADAVKAAGDQGLLRQLFVHRANHCMFTPAEQITAFQVLFDRLSQGQWGPLTPSALNDRAAALGGKYNVGALPGSAPVTVPPAFIDYTPPAFPREFDSRSQKP